MNFETCHGCAVALVNCDLSGLEDNNGAEDMARIVASIESMGLVTMIREEYAGRYFECFICGQNCIGEMATFERV